MPIVLAAVLTVLNFFGGLAPAVEVFTNARLQIFAAAILLTVAALIARVWKLALVAAIVVAVNALSVMPFIAPAGADPLPESASDVMRVMQYNVFFGNEETEAIADHVQRANADVVVLHEITSAQWSALEPRLRSDYAFASAVTVDEHQGQLGGGMAVLTRTGDSERLPVPASLSPDDRVLMAVSTVGAGGEELLVIGLHPHASRHEEPKVELRERQIAGVVELVATWDGPAVVVTDLNVTPTSPIYQAFLDDLGWRDPHRAVGWKSTWPAWGGPFGLPIDHVLVSTDIALHGYDVGDGAGSDHKSLTATISIAAKNPEP